MLIRGSDGKGWALLGKGTGKGSEERGEDGVMRAGCEVRVRKPVWEVELLGEKWTVGVEWKVCNGERSEDRVMS